jgi:predicted DNA-binding transcriptional regulator
MILPSGRSFELTEKLLKGTIDIHVHAGPHIFSSPRRVDPFQAAIQARDAGMQAIVYMDVFEMSNGTAWLVNRVIPDFKVYGGLILNTVYGGMNPRAVKTALSYGDGAKYVSFGAHSTYYQASREGRVIDGEFVPLSELFPKFKKEELDRCIRIPIEEAPGPELDEILKLISSKPDVYMITGHVSAAEGVRLVELSEEYGIKKTVVSSAVTKIADKAQLKYMVDKGAYIEYTLAAYTHTTTIPKTHYYVEREYASIDEGMSEEPSGGIKQVAEQIQEIGAEHCVISTDFGVYTLPTPVEGFREFIACLLDLGVSQEDIRKMSKTNPEKILGIT